MKRFLSIARRTLAAVLLTGLVCWTGVGCGRAPEPDPKPETEPAVKKPISVPTDTTETTRTNAAASDIEIDVSSDQAKQRRMQQQLERTVAMWAPKLAKVSEDLYDAEVRARKSDPELDRLYREWYRAREAYNERLAQDDDVARLKSMLETLKAGHQQMVTRKQALQKEMH